VSDGPGRVSSGQAGLSFTNKSKTKGKAGRPELNCWKKNPPAMKAGEKNQRGGKR